MVNLQIKSFLLGILVSSIIIGYILNKNFINREVLKLNRIYIDGKFYKLVEIR
jgi:hypothetical protein